MLAIKEVQGLMVKMEHKLFRFQKMTPVVMSPKNCIELFIIGGALTIYLSLVHPCIMNVIREVRLLKFVLDLSSGRS